MFGQSFEIHDLAVVALLIVLEGVLSIDNALVLGLLAKRLPKHQQSKGLTYGLVGAFVFRLIAVGTAAYLMRWRVVKLLGGGYLVYIAVRHLFVDRDNAEHVGTTPEGDIALIDDRTGRPVESAVAEVEIRQRIPLPVIPPDNKSNGQDSLSAGAAGVAPTGTAPASPRKCAAFWPTVAVIELTDIAFAIDSILAAIALIPSSTAEVNPKLWVVLTGGMLGVILMRFAAIIFIRLLERFPRFETAAYLLVTVIGLKLLVDWWFNAPPQGWPVERPFHGPADFHSPGNVAFWVFWLLMIAAFCVGFIPQRRREQPS